jgi:hypothetical protein
MEEPGRTPYETGTQSSILSFLDVQNFFANRGGGKMSQFELRGEGFPTKAATAGTYYTDTAATNGAVRWVRTADRWRVLWGETPWCNIKSMIINGWAVDTCRIMRRNDRVILQVQHLNGANATATQVFSGLPDNSGFTRLGQNMPAPESLNDRYFVVRANTTDTPLSSNELLACQVGNNAALLGIQEPENEPGVFTPWPSANFVVTQTIQWETSDDWPVILPPPQA